MTTSRKPKNRLKTPPRPPVTHDHGPGGVLDSARLAADVTTSHPASSHVWGRHPIRATPLRSLTDYVRLHRRTHEPMSSSDLLVQQMVVKRVMRDTYFDSDPPEAHPAPAATPSAVTRLRGALAAALIATGERLRPHPASTPCPEAAQAQPCR